MVAFLGQIDRLRGLGAGGGSLDLALENGMRKSVEYHRFFDSREAEKLPDEIGSLRLDVERMAKAYGQSRERTRNLLEADVE
jgi:hypothetical protein